MTQRSQLINRLPLNDVRQIEANRRNARKSTGPVTLRGQTALALQRPSTRARGRDSDRYAGGR
jgi:hypothetical protein